MRAAESPSRRIERTLHRLYARVAQRPSSASLFQCIGKLELERGFTYPSVRFSAHCAADVAFRCSLELAPNDVWTILYFASLHHARGWHEDAIALCGRAHELAPPLDLPLIHMGDAFASLRKYGDADRCYRQAVEIDPNSEVAKARLEKWLKFWIPERERRRRHAGRCWACGYDLRDDQSNDVETLALTCPNCGKTQPPTKR